MKIKDFEKLVEEGIEAIPRKFLEKLDNVAIVIEDEPDERQAGISVNSGGSVLFGLYEGIPRDERDNYSQVLPDKITIFRKTIEEFARSEEEIREIVFDTVWHEIAHHFGMDEEEVRAAERRRTAEKRKLRRSDIFSDNG